MIKNFINNKMAQSWAIAITFGLVVSTVVTYQTWQFWALMIMWFHHETLAYRMGLENGVIRGVTLSDTDRNRLKKIIENDDEDSE